jgi:hypothetical protein
MATATAVRGTTMRILMTIVVLLLFAVPGLAQDQLTSPYRQQAAAGLRGLDEKEIQNSKQGPVCGLPGPRS